VDRVKTDEIVSHGGTGFRWGQFRFLNFFSFFLGFFLFFFFLFTFSSLFLIFTLFFVLFLIIVSTHDFLLALFELFPVIPVQRSEVHLHGGINPLAVDVLVPDERLHLVSRRVLVRLSEAMGQSGLPEGVDEHVVHVLVHLYHLRLPLVQVNRFDLGDVHLQLPVLPGAT